MLEFLIVITVVFFLIINSNINKKFNTLKNTIDALTSKIQFLQQEMYSRQTVVKKQEVVLSKEIKISEEKISAEKPPIISSDTIITETQKPIVVENSSVEPLEFTQVPVENKIKKTVKRDPRKSWLLSFKEKNPDLEKFIGENLINKIGILILVLGISFFVKFAIDKDWINEPARVGIGVLCASLLMAVANKLKKNYGSFSSVLVAGAISILYFTIYIYCFS